MSERPVKCVVWDLDDTIWDGVLLEDREVRVRPDVVAALHELDGRGILHSIASRNDATTAHASLRAFGIDELFLHPQINWQSKADSIAEVARRLDLSLDAFAFVDDQVFEREEVRWRLPEVRCFDAGEAARLPSLPAFQPAFATEESRRRRALYRSEMRREEEAERFTGSPQEFLASLAMVFTVAPASEGDLRRAEELTIRTHQLNTTGRTYSYAELDDLRRSPRHMLLIAELEDRLGSYGKIGLALVALDADAWTIKLLLMSCRVLSRGVGTVLLNEIQRRAATAGVKLRADFVRNGRNRMMYVTYRLAGFREVWQEGDEAVLEATSREVPGPPTHLTIRVPD
jgi:FkbH-like protein